MNEQPLLAYHTWLTLPAETRAKLAKLFEIPRTGEVIVRSGTISKAGNIAGEVTQDGHSAKDLYAITVEKMQGLLHTTKTDFNALFWDTITHLEATTNGTYGKQVKKKGKQTHEPEEETE